MRTIGISFLFSMLLIYSCKKEEPVQPLPGRQEQFVATDVVIHTKAGYSTRDIFTFINSLGHKVEYLSPDFYTSELPEEQLNSVLSYFNGQPYINPQWPVYGYVQQASQRIIIFPRMYAVNDISNQHKWTTAMQDLQLNDSQTSFTIYFHVPEGEEKKWVAQFRTYPFIEWAELNYLYSVERL
jgi:hypothetical protein